MNTYFLLAFVGFALWQIYRLFRNLENRIFLLEGRTLQALAAAHVHEEFLKSAKGLEADREAFPGMKIGVPKEFIDGMEFDLDYSAHIRVRDEARFHWAWALRALDSNSEASSEWRSIFAGKKLDIECGDDIDGHAEATRILKSLKASYPDMISANDIVWMNRAEEYLAFLQRLVPRLYFTFIEWGRPIPDDLKKLADFVKWPIPSDVPDGIKVMTGKPGPYATEEVLLK